MKYILFAGENIGWYQRLLLKCAKKIINNPPAKANAAKTGSVTQAHGKRGTVTCRTNNLAQGEKFFAQPTRWVKKRYPLLFRKYEIQYIRDGICTGHRIRRVPINVPAGKKDTKIFNKNLINETPVQMSRLNRGGGEKGFLSPNKR